MRQNKEKKFSIFRKPVYRLDDSLNLFAQESSMSSDLRNSLENSLYWISGIDAVMWEIANHAVFKGSDKSFYAGFSNGMFYWLFD